MDNAEAVWRSERAVVPRGIARSLAHAPFGARLMRPAAAR